jgi:predicted cobalt transporter CbtA
VAVGPLIDRAEQLEPAGHEGHASAAAAPHEWEPADGTERTMYTVLGTTLTGIAFAALIFGVALVLGLELNVTRGVALGLLGFACCAFAPAMGLPPKPPGAAASATVARRTASTGGTGRAGTLRLVEIRRQRLVGDDHVFLGLAIDHRLRAARKSGARCADPGCLLHG